MNICCAVVNLRDLSSVTGTGALRVFCGDASVFVRGRLLDANGLSFSFFALFHTYIYAIIHGYSKSHYFYVDDSALVGNAFVPFLLVGTS